MSEVDTALTGADAAPAENTANPPEQTQENTATDPATEQPDPQKDEQARDEKGRFVQKRINELTREKHEARREAERTRQELEQLRQEMARLRQPEAPDPNIDLQGYIRHQAEQTARQLVEQERGQWQQQQETQRIQSLAQEYSAREADFAATHPDYEESVEAFMSVAGVNPPLAELLMTSDLGPAVVHYLGTHLDEAARISQLPPHMAAREVTRLETRLAQKPKPVTKAPDPVPTVGGGTAQTKDPDRMTTDEWVAWRRSQLS